MSVRSKHCEMHCLPFLLRLDQWASCVRLNKSECRVFLGHDNLAQCYRLGEEGLESGPAEKNLGVLVDSS